MEKVDDRGKGKVDDRIPVLQVDPGAKNKKKKEK